MTPTTQATARARRMQLAGLILMLTGGCAFGEADTAVENTCTLDSECESGSHCVDSICVQKGSTELTFSIEVTPMHMPDGSPPIPMSLGPFILDGRSRTFELPTPIAVEGKVFGRDKTNAVFPIAASLHFTPTEVPDGQPAKTIAATTTDTTDLQVELLRDVTYRVLIEPVDTTQTPYTLDFTALPGARLDVDYSTIKSTVQTYRVEGAPTSGKLIVRALDSETGEPVSSTGEVVDGRVGLRFPPKYAGYRLELTTRTSYVQNPSAGVAADENAKAAPSCDETTASFPVLSVDESVLRQDEAGTNVFALPQIPKPIVYSGEVALCSDSEVRNVDGMPMALEAQTLTFKSGDDAVQARYSATTTVTQSPDTGVLTFCTRVLPGDYVVVLTPPANLECEIFAQTRHIDAQSTAEKLKLQSPALLRGTVETTDHIPLAQATVDARALGLDLELPEGDVTVPSYNRSVMTTSDESGEFRLPMDVGSYDIVVKPPTDSGFAWQVLHNVDIDTRSRNFVAHVVLDTPVQVRGKLRYPDASQSAQDTLAGAEVRVYTQMPGGARSVELGSGIADDSGNISILVAPKLRKGL